jgi:hypothetical protein
MTECNPVHGALLAGLGLGLAVLLGGCDKSDSQRAPENTSPQTAPTSIPMGGSKSVTRFFVTSKGLGQGGNLGGLTGADAHCQALAEAQGAGDHTWRAYLSTEATNTQPAVNARDRIGGGPWYNAEGELIAQHLAQLHGAMSKLSKETAVTESADGVTVEQHEVLTGSRPDGTAFPAGSNRTCGNWTSSSTGSAQVGYVDKEGPGENPNSWNSARASTGCSDATFRSSGGVGLFYCFAKD